VEFWKVPEEALEVIDELRECGKWIGELVATKKDGAFFHTQVSATMITDEDGKPTYMMGSFLDVTDRKQAEEALLRARDELEIRVEERTKKLAKAAEELKREIEERKRAEKALIMTKARLQYLLDVSPAVIYSSKPSGDYSTTFISENIKGQLGYEPHEFTNDPKFWSRHVHPEDAPRVFNELSRILDKGYHCHEYRFKNKEDNYRWMYNEMRLVRDENGKPLEIVGFWLDITQRKQTEERLRESEEKYRTILDNIEEGYYEVDNHGNFTLFNESLCEISGYTRDDLMGSNYKRYIDSETAEDMVKVFNEVHSTGRSNKGVDWEFIGKDGATRAVEASVSLIKDSESKPVGFRGIIRDITEKKNNERALREKEKELEIKNRTLEETNTALRVLLDKREKDKAELEENMLYNVKELVIPYLEKLKTNQSDQKTGAYLSIMESNLNDVISPFLKRLSTNNSTLTPTQIQVANLIKCGKTTKEIAHVLDLSEKTIEDHRKNIRKRLGILNRKINLKSYLLALGQLGSH
jgi:PAS domain S-box-containing protein